MLAGERAGERGSSSLCSGCTACCRCPSGGHAGTEAGRQAGARLADCRSRGVGNDGTHGRCAPAPENNEIRFVPGPGKFTSRSQAGRWGPSPRGPRPSYRSRPGPNADLSAPVPRAAESSEQTGTPRCVNPSHPFKSADWFAYSTGQEIILKAFFLFLYLRTKFNCRNIGGFWLCKPGRPACPPAQLHGAASRNHAPSCVYVRPAALVVVNKLSDDALLPALN